MNANKLRILYNNLRLVQDRVDMGDVLANRGDEDKPFETCGAIGCAIGYAALMPEFPELTANYFGGLYWNKKQLDGHCCPQYVTAGLRLFDLAEWESSRLFKRISKQDFDFYKEKGGELDQYDFEDYSEKFMKEVASDFEVFEARLIKLFKEHGEVL